MAANTSPISPIAPNTSFPSAAVLTSANTALDGTGTTQLFHTAGANGSKVNRVRVLHRGTNIATVLRIFLNNGNDPTVATNNQLIAEETMAANTISQVARSTTYDIYINLALKPNNRLYYSIGTAVAAGHAVTADAGDY